VFVFCCAAASPAASICVNPGGNGGCKATIGAAVAAAAANDTITVARGVYAEDVIVDKPLSLIGNNAVIDGSGLANGINIDGLGHPGLKDVAVSGFVVANANFQGIVVTNASNITITGNHVLNNDRSLQPFASGGPICPGLPAPFQAGEGLDCGEGIHLSGVSGSTVSDNLVERNAGGILISDDTGPNHDNLITRNTVQDNPYDCGITLASHHFATGTVDPLVGVYHITVADNASLRNGLKTGEGAGIGIFAGPPGAQNWGDTVIRNAAIGNALPGVALHSHSPFQKLTDHRIAGNFISGNGPDSDPGTTVPTGISIFNDAAAGAPDLSGIVITGNTIRNEGIGVGINATGSVALHLNNFSVPVGIDNIGTATVNATLNWWGCANDHSHNCATVTGVNVQSQPTLSDPYEGFKDDGGRHGNDH